MRKLLLLVLLSLPMVDSFAQEENYSTFEDGTSLLTYNIGMGNQLKHELRFEKFVHKRWSLIYSTSYTVSPTGYRKEFVAPLGVSLAVFNFFAVANGGYGSGSALLFLVPDGVATHFYLHKGFDFSPYINVSGLSFQFDKIYGNKLVYAPSAGLRLIKCLGDHFVVAAEQSFIRTRENGIRSNSGISLSVQF